MREMKDSGVEWIGEIPKDWEITQTRRLFRNEKNIVGDAADEYERLALTLKGVIKRSKNDSEGLQPEKFERYQILRQNELVFKMIDLENVNTSRVGLSPYTGLVSPAYIVLKNDSDDNRYEYYWFMSMYYNEVFNHLGGDGVRSALNVKDMLSLPIPNISKIQKKTLADYLDAKCSKIDEFIEKQQAIIEKLKEYKLSIITEVVTKGLNPDVEMMESGAEFVGKIPQNWSIAKLGNLFDFIGGYAFNSEMYVSESQNQVVRIGNVKNGYMLLDSNPVFVNDETAERANKFLIKPNYILFTMTGTKGKRDYFFTHVVTEEDCKGKRLYINQRVGCFVAKKGVHPAYYGYLLKDNKILDGIFLYETGTANQGNLGIDSISRTKVHVPPYEEQCKIAEYLDKKCNMIDSNIYEKGRLIIKFQEYKKSLIYEVVTGKKEV